jgi:hypothetical protein
MRVKAYYYKKDGQAFMVDEMLKKQIDKAIAHGMEANDSDDTLYPIFDTPSEHELRAGKTKEAVWLIRPHSTPTLRWYWQVQEHKKKHSECKQIGDGLCAFKMVRYAEWNADSKKWELLPMVNHASAEQEQVLDNK